MGADSNIEWTDHTFNAWFGCTKVSPGCDHCYAEALMDKRLGRVEWGGERRRTSATNWRQPLKWNRDAERAGVRRKVFCASLADVFDNQVPPEWRRDLWALIESTPHLDWLLLTKRPQNIRSMIWTGWANNAEAPPRNIWLGTTAENQVEADRRIPHLLTTPAAVRFLSCEPLLGPIDLHDWLTRDWHPTMPPETTPRIDWVIAGSESGPGARPCDLVWVRFLRDQCVAAGIAFFWKQHVESGRKISTPEMDGRQWREFPR